MGEITTLSVATSGKGSLRTTVPMSILKHFKLKAGDKLDWDFEARNNELVILVRPLKNSTGTSAVSTENLSETKTSKR
jgi:bifunctional DNA-binding transcriptional regulator/antitoxin component of YhaV-PrlF toxin-antitoxin module